MQDTEVDYSNIITIGGQDIAIGDSSSAKKALPPGTERTAYQGYEEVCVPAVDPGKLLKDEKLVQISELDGWAQSAFKGYQQLNRIQSRIFDVRAALLHVLAFAILHPCSMSSAAVHLMGNLPGADCHLLSSLRPPIQLWFRDCCWMYVCGGAAAPLQWQ